MGRTLLITTLVLSVFSGEAFATKDILTTLAERTDLRIFLVALNSTELSAKLTGEGPFTLFAANDFAFSKLHSENVDALLLDPKSLNAVLRYHLVPRLILAAEVQATHTAPTLHGQRLTFSNNGQRVDSAHLVVTDIAASNGVIHIIDALVVPQDMRQIILRPFEWR